MSGPALPRAERFLSGCAALAGAPAPAPADLSACVQAGRDEGPIAEVLAELARGWGLPDPSGPLATLRMGLGDVPLRGPRWARHPGPVAAIDGLAAAWTAGAGLDLRLRALTLAYAAERWAIPYLCLQGEDREALEGSEDARRLCLAARLREAVYAMDGELLERVAGDAGSGTYRGASGAELIVEWHELLAAEAGWRGATPRD